MSINGVEVGGLKGAAVGGAAGAADGSWAGPLGALVGGVIGGIIGFFVGGGSSASNNARVYYANFQTPYYDDEGWWALAWIKAYDLTLDPQYLKMAEFLFNDMTNGWDTTFGGGIFWAKDHKNGDGSIFPYKNAIANELFMAVATRLYLRTKELSYLTWAEKEWQWFYSSGLIATGDPKGTDPSCQVTTAGPSLCPGAQDLVYDSLTNVGIPDGTKTFWTYNCGVLLQALCDLYIITTNEELLSTAQGIAMAAIGYFQLRWDTNLQQLVYTGNSFNGFSPVLTERNPNSSVSTCHFKGILMRNLGALFANDPNSQTGKSIGEFITNNANSVLANLNPASQIGKEWNVMPDSVDFIRQSAGIDAINAANRVVQFTSPISLKATLARLGLNQTVQLKETIGWLTPSVRSWVIAFST
jgi:predicted alpha-1,6-mannanase (GH76 family)